MFRVAAVASRAAFRPVAPHTAARRALAFSLSVPVGGQHCSWGGATVAARQAWQSLQAQPVKQSQTPYEVLGVSTAASSEDIERAYTRLVLQLLPEYEVDDPEAEAAEGNLRMVNMAYAALAECVVRQ
mmetsp:Transcript_15023/g.38122  ORF Transcript_15023/g.38122 Transcript_15023/m.38122 type:complete len:128 (+) Transcript_15023:96-479(+)